MARKLLWGSLALAPITFVVDLVAHPGDTTLFVLAAAALVPLAWLIGEATEHAASHTGPGVGGFLNATFGNAPEVIIALIAVNEGLTEVVRGSLTGSVVSNLLLVLGLSLVAGGRGRVDRTSTFVSLGLVGLAALLFLVPAVPGWHGDHERHSIAVLSIPVSVVLLVLYLAVTVAALRRHRRLHAADDVPEAAAWSLTVALVALGVATVATAGVAEILVHSLEAFAERAGLTDFFVAAVIVALVGNAAEHGGAVVVAYRGKIRLAAEIALASSAQVAVFLVPLVALVSWAIEPLALAFRPVEIASVAAAVAVVALVLADGRSSRLRGAVLVAAYGAVVAAYFLAGDR